MEEAPERIFWYKHDGEEYIQRKFYDSAQARIKELEEGLRFYAERKHVASWGAYRKFDKETQKIYEQEDENTFVEDGTTARKALERKSEGS